MERITKFWFLEDFDLFKKLGRLKKMSICEIIEMDNFNKGDLISLKNERSIFFLKRGTVKIVNTETNTIKYVVKKGHLFGELALYDKVSASNEQALALEDSVICYIEFYEMEKLMEQHKSLKNGILKIYGLRIKKLERRLQNLLYKDSTERIKEFVKEYILEHGEIKEQQIIAKNLLTHKDIATLTSTSRQTVSNVLSNMRKLKEIGYNAKHISMPLENNMKGIVN